MSQFEVDPATIRQAGGALDQTVEDLDAVVDRFESTLAELGECWGGDDIGALIGMCYLPAYETAIACLDNNLDELSTYGGRLTLMADSYESTESENEGELRRVGSMLDNASGWV